MPQEYRTHVQVDEDGKLTLENLPFAGEAVEVIVRPDVQEEGEEREQEATDALSVLESMIGTVEGPPDWAAEHDHYIHGTPKRSDRQQ
jgi:hypothetical protein